MNREYFSKYEKLTKAFKPLRKAMKCCGVPWIFHSERHAKVCR